MAILALDQGTTSSRSVVFGSDGKILSIASRQITQYYPEAGYVEHDPVELLRSELSTAQECLKEYDGTIEAVGIANQRETVIVWNRNTGIPVYNAIVWQCRRTAAICDRLVAEGFDKYIYKATGLPTDAYFSGTKIKWILDNIAGARESAERGELICGTVDCWLIWNLTGNHLTDITNASRTMLFDIDTLDWNVNICERLGIPVSMLPEVRDNCTYFGKIKSTPEIPEKLRGLPIYASIGDQQAAMFGQQCVSVGDVKNTYGTGCFTLMNTGSSIRYVKNLVTTVGWKIGGELVYAVEGSVFNAGSSIQWLRDRLGIIVNAPECDILASSVTDSGGAVFVSAFTGLGAPYWDMYARGTLLGLTRDTGRAHICRAVLEGIACQVADLVFTMKEGTGCQISSVFVDGGACVSDVMMQFQSDILRCDADRPECTESTALGAAFMAGLGAGVWNRSELIKIRKTERLFTPVMDNEKASAIYRRWKNAVAAVRSFSGDELYADIN